MLSNLEKGAQWLRGMVGESRAQFLKEVSQRKEERMARHSWPEPSSRERVAFDVNVLQSFVPALPQPGNGRGICDGGSREGNIPHGCNNPYARDD